MRRPSDLDLCGRQPEAPHNPRPVPHSAAFNCIQLQLEQEVSNVIVLLLIWPRCFLEIYLASATASDAALLLLLLAASSYALALAVAVAVALGSCMLQVAAVAPQSRRWCAVWLQQSCKNVMCPAGRGGEGCGQLPLSLSLLSNCNFRMSPLWVSSSA